MLWLWYADRASGGAAYVLLVASALTGIPYDHPAMGTLHRVSRAIHTPLSWTALAALAVHGVVGAFDVTQVLRLQVPTPSFGLRFLAAGTAVGVGGLGVTVVAALAFVDPKRFERPWRPRWIHALAYAGFGLSTVHTLAIGTDVVAWTTQIAAAVGALVLAALVARLVVSRRARGAGT